jgi:hypothetical protein
MMRPKSEKVEKMPKEVYFADMPDVDDIPILTKNMLIPLFKRYAKHFFAAHRRSRREGGPEDQFEGSGGGGNS